MAYQQPTNEQLDRCHRITNDQTGEVWYQVESETTDAEYEVHFIAGKGFTCTCPAGQEAFRYCRSTCKHCRCSHAHAQEFRAQEQRERVAAQQAEDDDWHEANYRRMSQEHRTNWGRAQARNATIQTS